MAVKKKDTWVLPSGEDWSYNDVCVGGSPAKPTLTDVQNQLVELQNASRESRAAVALAIRCGFCNEFHQEAQPPVSELLNSDSGPTVEPVPSPEADPALTQLAGDIVINTGNMVTINEADEDLEDFLNDASDPTVET